MDTNTTNNIDWEELKEQYKKSGIGLKRWCELNNVPFNKMRYQLYGSKNYKTHHQSSKTASLIKVIPTKQEPVKSVIDINIGKATITVDDSTNLQLLAKVMEVLS